MLGVLMDDGMTRTYLAIRNAAGQEIARARYKEFGEAEIVAGDAVYRVREASRFRAASLVDAKNPSAPAVCRFSGSPYRTASSSYEIPGFAPIAVIGSFSSFLRDRYAVHRGSEKVGELFSASKLSSLGAVMIIPAELPVPVRAFIFAIEYRRLSRGRTR